MPRLFKQSLDQACRVTHLVAIEERVAFYLLTYRYNEKKYKRKERSIRSINPLKLVKWVKVLPSAKRENKFPPLQFRQDIFVFTPIHEAKQ